MVSAATSLGGTSRFRQRKLNVKTPLKIHKENDVEVDDGGAAGEDASDAALGLGMGLGVGGLPKVESGVESKEEKV